MRIRTYSELSRRPTFEDRFDYLVLAGQVGQKTFGFDRWINQLFYTGAEWRSIRQVVIVRDNGCDLGIEGYDIHSGLLVHHMNPLTIDDIRHGAEWMLDPEYLITTTHRTHNAIHYGDASLLAKLPAQRRSGDTKLW